MLMGFILILVLVAAGIYAASLIRKRGLRVPGDLVVLTKRAEQVGYESYKKGYPKQHFGNAPIDSPKTRKNFEAHREAYEKGWARAKKETQERDGPEPPKPSHGRDVLKLVRAR